MLYLDITRRTDDDLDHVDHLDRLRQILFLPL